VKLPIRIPYPPMEASIAEEIPTGDEWQYEPKWDGFRCLAFRDGEEVELQSKAGKPLTRYFPDLVAALSDLKPSRFVLDGEIVIPVDGELSFDELLQRIHPAASRVKMLSEQHPCLFIVFDRLVDDRGASLVDEPLAKRRSELERWAKKSLRAPGIALSPATRDFQEARRWFQQMRGSLDGVIAKRLDLPYASETRAGMQKIKNRRTADCVIGGFRYGAGKKVVGSLLLGLYDDAGLLDHVGFTSAFSADERSGITRKLEPLIHEPGFTGRSPGGPSRWSKREMDDWKPLAPKLVVEVEYDHFTGHRFRHGTKLLRWRPDKEPRQCTMRQVERETKSALSLLKLS
jgi:ATP-dependent DNA ligase